MKKTHYFILFLGIYSCSDKLGTSNAENIEQFEQPDVYPMQSKNGYMHNLVTGDSILPIINSVGDTIKTGAPVPFKLATFPAYLFEEPKKINLLPPTQKLSNRKNRLVVKKKNPTLKVLWEKTEQASLDSRFSDFVLTNSQGKKVKTGVPIAVKGTAVKWLQKKPVSALPLVMTDNAVGNIQSLDVDQGLNSSYILSMLQDRSGNVWIGTYGGGVSRYNGHSFTHFDQKSGIPNDIVKALHEDSEGNIWIGSTGHGLSKFNGESFIYYNEVGGLASNEITCFYEDDLNNIWIGMRNGVSKYKDDEFTHYSIKQGIPGSIALSICGDYKGHIWVGTENGICVYDNKNWKTLQLPDEVNPAFVTSIVARKDSSVWFSIAGSGVYKFKNDSLTDFSVADGLSSVMIWNMIEDNTGKLWLATSDAGVMSFDEKEYYYISKKDGLPNEDIRTILEDNSGNLWFGSYGGGVYRYKPNSFYHLNESDGMTNSIARAITEDQYGNIWFGTSSGLCIYNGTEFTYLDKSTGLDNLIIKSIFESKDGIIWIGTDGQGLYRYDGNSMTIYKTENGLSNNKVLSIYEDNELNIWLATNGGGVTKIEFDDDREIKSFARFSDYEGLSNSTVVCLAQDKDNEFWFATDGGGISKTDGKTIINYSEAEGLSHLNTLSFTQDVRGNFWVGTYGSGLNVFDGENILHITENEGLSSNTVWGVKEIPNGKNPKLWVSTEKGLNLIEVETVDDSNNDVSKYRFKINRFTKQDGLKGLDFYSNSVCLDTKNKMWWGSGKGVEVLDLNSFTTSTIVPNPKMEYIEINEDFIDFRNLTDANAMFDFGKVEPFANYPSELTLPYNKNHLTFHFSAIDWTSPHKINYRFRLVGLSDEWSAVSERTMADYRNIPYGDYSFEVYAIGESQVWSDVLIYNFTINPPWWHRWWFRIFVGLFVLLIFYSIYKIRTAALIRQQKILEKKVEDRTEDLNQEKLKVEEKHKEITDSINYAERIQRSFLATKNLLDENLQDYFVFFQPKGIVSGDFYWASKFSNGNFAYACADSTGHGVPGAIMSILNISSLELAIKENKIEPAEILNYTRNEIINRLKKDGSADGGKDGMDASLIVLNKERNKLTYAAANNSVWILRNKEIIELNADKMPVGKHDKDQTPFSQNEFALQKNDVIYSFTDGMPDQFGGPKGKKYKYKKLKAFVISIGHQPMEQQHQLLKQELETWRGELEQVDDICIIGVRV